MRNRPQTKLILAATALMLCAGGANLKAQDRPQRGNFDPEQMRQRMMERYREQLEVKDDAEWKLIEERIQKVVQARMEVGGGGGFFGRRGGPGGPGGQGGGGQGGAGGGQGADNAQRRPRGFGVDASPEGEALQKAIEAKAPADEVKAKLAKLREARKVKEGQLEKAQEDLRKVLSVRQEAQAVLAGLLK